MTNISKNDLSIYYSALFEESKYLEKWYEFFHYSILCSMIASIFLESISLYSVVILGLLSQIGLFVSRHMSNRSQTLAHELQRISMLDTAYTNDSFRFEISQIIGKISIRAHNMAKARMEKKDESTNYNLPLKTKDGSLIIRLMIQENAYWNHHLFGVCSRQSFKNFTIVLSLVIIVILLSIPFNTGIISDPEHSFLRIGLIILSFLRIWEELEKALVWSNASETMLSIDNSLNNIEYTNSEFIMFVFSNYNIAKVKTHPIPDKVCKEHYEKLHNGWIARTKEIFDINR